MEPYALFEELAEPVHGGGKGQVVDERRWRLPILHRPELSGCVQRDLGKMGTGHLAHVRKHRVPRVIVDTPAEEIRQWSRIHGASHTRQTQQRRDFRGKGELAAHQGVVERLDRELITREHQGLLRLVEHCEGIHSHHAIECARAPRAPCFEQHLGVGTGAEYMPHRSEFGSQLEVVVYLTVENDVTEAVRGTHRLRGSR